MRKNQHVLDAMEGVAYNLNYLQVDKNAFSARFAALPEREEIPVPVDEQLIVEFYTRLT
jgi:small subunit ribosomal protein S4